jgi:hypothetical protein
MSDHNARAFGALARAFLRSAGTLGSGSLPDGMIASETTSPTAAPAASRIFLVTLSQWLPRPSGSSVARKGEPLIVPSTAVMPRVGSFALATFDRIRNVQEAPFGVAGRNTFALNRIFAAVFNLMRRGNLKRQHRLCGRIRDLCAVDPTERRELVRITLLRAHDVDNADTPHEQSVSDQ